MKKAASVGTESGGGTAQRKFGVTLLRYGAFKYYFTVTVGMTMQDRKTRMLLRVCPSMRIGRAFSRPSAAAAASALFVHAIRSFIFSPAFSTLWCYLMQYFSVLHLQLSARFQPTRIITQKATTAVNTTTTTTTTTVFFSLTGLFSGDHYPRRTSNEKLLDIVAARILVWMPVLLCNQQYQRTEYKRKG